MEPMERDLECSPFLCLILPFLLSTLETRWGESAFPEDLLCAVPTRSGKWGASREPPPKWNQFGVALSWVGLQPGAQPLPSIRRDLDHHLLFLTELKLP